MPAGWRRPALILLSVLLGLAACQASASTSPSPSAVPTGTACPTGAPVESGGPSPALSATAEPTACPPPTQAPTPRPTASPTAAPTPSPLASGCSAGQRVAAGQPEIIVQAPNAGQAMALTFDMGGRLDPALDILQFLIDNHVCATLFPTGAMSQTPVGQQVLTVVRAHPELFELGNHTMHHCNLRNGGEGSPTTAPCQTGGPPNMAFVTAELTDAAAILEAGSGQDPAPYWRAPYGVYTDQVLATAAGLGYTKTIMWSIDTIDWRPISDGGPTAEQITTTVVTSATSGSIVLMHLGGYETLDAITLMVPALRDRGLLLTSISDLLN